MATAKDCHAALLRLADSLHQLDPELRAKHVPRRTVSCTVSDLDVVFVARVDEHGVHDVKRDSDGGAANADVRVVVTSKDLLALAAGNEDLLHAWLKGRIHISAPVRDVLRLRSLFGL